VIRLAMSGHDRRWSRSLALVLGGVCVSCATFCVIALASESDKGTSQTRFADRERVQQFLNNRPDAAVRLLETVLTQEQADALERAMFPEPANDERRSAYEQVQTMLRRVGLGSDDALVQDISARIESLARTASEGDKP
jgi:hypothetical protein